MQIKRLVIENFKSIERIELIEPNPFTVFVGPNGSGKSNIFEALEFVNLSYKVGDAAVSLFGGENEFINRRKKKAVKFLADLNGVTVDLKWNKAEDGFNPTAKSNILGNAVGTYEQVDDFYERFSRVFVNNDALVKLRLNDDQRLSLSGSNLEKVLMRILKNSDLEAEIFEWLTLFVPGFDSVAIAENPFDGKATLLWFEKFSEKPFTKSLISDGTYSIIAILTAVYQSDKPQFLCIEEPENGLNPKVIKELVQLFRFACEEYGHYIWLNTHSQSLVSVLTPEEIVLVDKVDGATKTKQVAGLNLHGLPMDEAWLSNALGGGIPW